MEDKDLFRKQVHFLIFSSIYAYIYIYIYIFYLFDFHWFIWLRDQIIDVRANAIAEGRNTGTKEA